MSADGAPVLGVERSLLGKRWRARLADSRAGLSLAQAIEAPEPLGRVLAARGVAEAEAEAYLNPTLRDQLPDPSHLRDMDKAVARLARAVEAGEKIAIFGDYDVDGATSAALLGRFFRAAAGQAVTLYIPDRRREGYGPNAPALRQLAAQDVRVVVTVDCGITALDALGEAADAGLDVIVVDHHVGGARLPRAHALVDPNRLDEDSPHRQLAAVGVAFLLVVGLNRRLREAGWYRGRREPALMRWLDLVALGTVCDVVPLTGVNRAFVRQGLRVLARRLNLGLAALADAAGGLDGPPGVYHLGFILGPRVNAGGRIGESGLGARLLSTEDAAEAAEIARRLDALNRERRAIEAAVLEAAIRQVESAGGAGRDAPLVVAHDEGWHPGVIGIVASRLKERYGRPAAVVAWQGEVGKASCRSLPGIDIGTAIVAARQAGLLVDGGGHAMAGGFTVERTHFAALRRALEARLGAGAEARAHARGLGLDGALSAEGANATLLEMLEAAGPYGAGNPEPRFAVAGARLLRADVVGQGHVRCRLAGRSGRQLKGIAFRAADNAMGRALLAGAASAFHLAGRLRPDRHGGPDRVELQIDDAAPADPSP